MNKKYYRWLVGLYAGIILLLSTMPGSSLPRYVFPQFDKIIHFTEYFIFGLLAVKSLNKVSPVSLILLILGGVVFSGLDETWQSFRPGRDASVADMFADGIGFIAGSLLASWRKLNSSGKVPYGNG